MFAEAVGHHNHYKKEGHGRKNAHKAADRHADRLLCGARVPKKF